MTNSIITLMGLLIIMMFAVYIGIMVYGLTAKLRSSCYSMEDDSYNYRRHIGNVVMKSMKGLIMMLTVNKIQYFYID